MRHVYDKVHVFAWAIFKRNVRAQPLQPNLRELTHVTLIRCAILQQFLHRYIISWGKMYIAIIATAGGHTMYINEIKTRLISILLLLLLGCAF